MKASQIKKSIETLIPIKKPAFIWGAPGIGKSDIMRQIAEEQKLELIDVRAILLDPVDLRGLPYVNGDKKAHWCPPDFLPYDPESRGILLLDELSSAPPMVQAACYQLVLDRKLGESRLPDGWAVFAAGNRETDKAVVHRMPSALANRFTHLNMEADLEDWVSWALSHNIPIEIVAFLRFRPELLHNFDPKKNDKAFPTPRSWEVLSTVYGQNPDPDIQYELYSGIVGEGATAELMGFLKIFRSLPNPDLVLMNPDQADVPTDPATLYALCGALSNKASEQTAERLFKYSHRLPPEFSVLLARDSVRKCKAIVNTRPYIEWVSKNSNVLI